MEKLIDRIREKYPTPKKYWDLKSFLRSNSSKEYCVLMAYARFIGLKKGSPLALTGLSEDTRYDIVAANDSGNFELAWELLAQAIEKKERNDVQTKSR